MLFHTQAPLERAAVAKPGEMPKPEYRLDILRVLAGFAVFVLLVVGAFVAHAQNWDDGVKAFLHMAEIAFGGLIGLIVGEQLAIRHVKQ